MNDTMIPTLPPTPASPEPSQSLPVVAWEHYNGGSFISDYAKVMNSSAEWTTFYSDPIVRQSDAQAAIDALTQELHEQCRLNGMGGEREAALLAKVDALRQERDKWYQEAAAQAVSAIAATDELAALRAQASTEAREPVDWSGRIVEINYETCRAVVRYEGEHPGIGVVVRIDEWASRSAMPSPAAQGGE